MSSVPKRNDFARTLFWPLLLLVLILTGYSVTAHNPLSRHLLLQSAIVVIAIAWINTKRRGLPRRVSLGILTGAIAALLAHCALAELPITSVGLVVSKPHASVEVVVVPAHKEDRVDPIPDWLSPRHQIVKLSYVLDAPIVANQRMLKFKFDHSHTPYRIVEVSYGTDFFRIPFRLSRDRDHRIERVVRVNETNNRFEARTAETQNYYALTSKIRSKPALLIPAVEDFIQQKVPSSAQILVRLIWFSIHLAVILAAWHWPRIIVLTGFNRIPDGSRAN